MIRVNESGVAVPPGEIMKELLEERNESMEQFCIEMDMDLLEVVSLLEGESHLTSDIAERLHTVFSLSDDYWMNLETLYEKIVFWTAFPVKENHYERKLLKEYERYKNAKGPTV